MLLLMSNNDRWCITLNRSKPANILYMATLSYLPYNHILPPTHETRVLTSYLILFLSTGPPQFSNWLYRSKAKKTEEKFLSDCHSTLTTGWGGKNSLNEWTLHWSFSSEYRGFRLRTGNYFHIFNSAVFPPSVWEFIWFCLLSFFLGVWTCTLIQHTVVYFCF